MIKLAFRNPFAIIAAVIAIVVLGINSVARLPVDNFPEINIPVVMVATFYQGFSPEEMDRAITSRIERAFTQASHLDHIEAKSYNGVSLIKVFFQPGVDVGAGESELISLENTVLRKLPRGIQPSTFLRFDVTNIPVCQVVVHSKTRTEAQLYDLAQFTIRQQLASIPGVAIWPSFGGKYREIVVNLDPNELQAQGLTPFDVVQKVNASNLILPGGDANVGNRDVEVEANTEIPLVSEINRIPVKSTPDGAIVYVKDVAHAVDGSAIQTNIVRVDGKRAVIVPVGLAAGGNTIQVVDGVRAMLPKLVGVPPDVKMDVVFDQSRYIRGALRSLTIEAGVGSALAALFMWLIMGDVRAMLGIVIAIPLSVLACLIGLAAFHQTLNSMTLAGIALSIGMLVTNATVVLENTFRLMEAGEPPGRAAFAAAQEVAVPMLAATACILLVFMPLQGLSGIARFLFVPLGLTVSLAMAASYLLAMTLLPIYCGRFLVPRRATQASMPARVLSWLQDRQSKALRWVFDHRRPALALALLFWLAALPLASVVGLEFFPRLDSGEILLSVHAPQGMRLEETEALVARIEQRIQAAVPARDVRMVISNIGLPQGFNSIFSDNAGSDRATVQIQLVDASRRNLSEQQIIRLLRDDIQAHVPEAEVAYRPSGIVTGVVNGGLPVPIDVQIYGPDLETERHVAGEVLQMVRSVPGTVGARMVQNLAEPYLDVAINRDKAGLLGLKEQGIADDLITSLASNLFLAPSYWLDPLTGNDYFLVVQDPESRITSYKSIEELPVSAPGRQGDLLENLATLTERRGPQEVDQMNLRPVLDIETDLSGRDLGAVAQDLSSRLARLHLPPKTTVRIAGQANTLARTVKSFALGLVLAAVLIYLVMAALFRSFLEPLSVLAGVVLGLAGVLWALWLGGSSLNVQSMVGILMLMGLSAYNGIILVAAARDRLGIGLPPEEAAMEAARLRLRPILVAMVATILGLVPSALKTGMHAEPSTPLAQAVIGGLLVSTLGVFLLVPMLWAAIARPVPLSVPSPADPDGVAVQQGEIPRDPS